MHLVELTSCGSYFWCTKTLFLTELISSPRPHRVIKSQTHCTKNKNHVESLCQSTIRSPAPGVNMLVCPTIQRLSDSIWSFCAQCLVHNSLLHQLFCAQCLVHNSLLHQLNWYRRVSRKLWVSRSRTMHIQSPALRPQYDSN